VLSVSFGSTGGLINPSEMDQILGYGNSEAGGRYTAYGIVKPEVASVRFELSDGTTVSADTKAVPSYPFRIWLIGFSWAPRYRAFEQLDASGAVISRQGRPPR
jgi:hypothetical protein